MAKFYNMLVISGRVDPLAMISGQEDAEVESKLDLALDWFRYHPNCYLVYSDKDANEWHRLLRPVVTETGRLFIVRADVDDRAGWMDNTLWNWIARAKTLDSYRVGDKVFVWVESSPPLKVYEGVVSGVLANGKPRVVVQGTPVQLGSRTPVRISKLHPVTRTPESPVGVDPSNTLLGIRRST